VFHCATYTDVGMALNLNRLIGSAPLYKQWQHCWKKCVQAQGMCFEGGRILVDEYIK
jgi:hypothetical protein